MHGRDLRRRETVSVRTVLCYRSCWAQQCGETQEFLRGPWDVNLREALSRLVRWLVRRFIGTAYFDCAAVCTYTPSSWHVRDSWNSTPLTVFLRNTNLSNWFKKKVVVFRFCEQCTETKQPFCPYTRVSRRSRQCVTLDLPLTYGVCCSWTLLTLALRPAYFIVRKSVVLFGTYVCHSKCEPVDVRCL